MRDGKMTWEWSVCAHFLVTYGICFCGNWKGRDSRIEEGGSSGCGGLRTGAGVLEVNAVAGCEEHLCGGVLIVSCSPCNQVEGAEGGPIKGNEDCRGVCPCSFFLSLPCPDTCLFFFALFTMSPSYLLELAKLDGSFVSRRLSPTALGGDAKASHSGCFSPGRKK